MSAATIHGSCHCGNIQFDLDWPGDASRIAARGCGCSFCQKRGGTWTSNPDAHLSATIENANLVSPYRFGTGTAVFHVCAVCGVVPFVSSEIEGRLYAVVNIAAFDGNESRTFDVAGTDFDGEDETSRLARRQQNWIGKVTLQGLAAE